MALFVCVWSISTLSSISFIPLQKYFLNEKMEEEEKTTAAAKEDEGGYNKYQGTK